MSDGQASISTEEAESKLGSHVADLRRLCGGVFKYERHPRYLAVVRRVITGESPVDAIRTVRDGLGGL